MYIARIISKVIWESVTLSVTSQLREDERINQNVNFDDRVNVVQNITHVIYMQWIIKIPLLFACSQTRIFGTILFLCVCSASYRFKSSCFGFICEYVRGICIFTHSNILPRKKLEYPLRMSSNIRHIVKFSQSWTCNAILTHIGKADWKENGL